MDNEDAKPKRRVRYTGKHPKAFQEKYKELAPEQYAADVEKIIQQGKTPAGMHRSICINEILDLLKIQPGDIGLDATLGYGGHSVELIKALLPDGHLFATDVDSIELPKTKERLAALGYGDDVLSIRKMNFSNLDLIIYESGLLNFILADLGVSSMQIDNPERGFSFKVDGPLDLRLNPKSGASAATYLSKVSEQELADVLAINSDEPYAAEIAKSIINNLSNGNFIETTSQFQNAIKQAISFLPEFEDGSRLKKTCQRCFQALRIEVNNEFSVLEKFLDKIPNALAPGGKVVIMSFHSGEDRRVKKSFQELFRKGIYSKIAEDIIRPSVEECAQNPRAKSAKLRWAIK
jgi:16S rRNA (cytosine1402-N4)-methyltransferase